MITYSDSKEIDPQLLLSLFDQAPWAQGRTLEGTKSMLSSTNLVISAWDNQKIVGCGRVITDYIYRASIWDIIIDKNFQGQDLGSGIVHKILNHPTLVSVELFWLCTQDKQAFYRNLGFSDKEQTGMVWDRRTQAPRPNF
ncbi:MAG: GNAT family N-acetyltransferase [Nitrospirae bacterium]|nr:GNAT family N-acetyltransferase [Nitrospirota bacterium]